MSNKELVKIIDENNLFYTTINKMAGEISKLTNLSLEEAKTEIKRLLEDGDLMLDDDKRLFLTSKRGYVKCRIIANKKGYAFAERLEKDNNTADIFIPKNYLKGALDDDIVLVQIVNKQEDGSEDGEVISILKHITEYIVGEFKTSSTKCYVQPDDEKFPVVRINRPDRLGAVDGDKVVARIIFDDSASDMRGVITEKLGKAGTVSAEEMSIIRASKIRDEFPDAVLREAEDIVDTVTASNKRNRRDFTGLNVITIDGEDSRDFDDAISVERTKTGYILGVHIADVSYYVHEGSAMDDEAFLRGNSVYFPDKVIPMLPEKLSNGICSLREGVERLTLSCVMTLDKNAKLVSSEVVNSIIKSKHRMTYTNIQKMLDGDKEVIDGYKDIYDDVLTYADISKKLKALRKARGEIRLDIPEPKVYEKANGEIDRIEKEMQDESHELIESLMILANETIAEKFFSKKLPFVYRIHEKPDSAKVTKLNDTFKALGINANIDSESPSFYDYQKLVDKLEDDPRKFTLMKIILRSMMKASYSEKCLGHFGIASSFYCHFTSPIRRYPDLLIHRIIKHYLAKESVKNLHYEFDEKVASCSMQASLTEKRADEVERAVDDYKKALYMKEHLGEVYDGTISGVHEFGIFVELDNTIEGLIRFEYLQPDSYDYDEKSQVLKGLRHCYKLGDSIKVVCVNANTRLRQIDFDLAEKLNKSSLEELIAMRGGFSKYSKNNSENKKNNKNSKKTKEKTNKKQCLKTNKQKNKGGNKKTNKKAYSRKNIKIEY